MSRAYVIKVEVADPKAVRFDFRKQRTMYGGKQIAPGDVIYIFASENEGGQGLVARGVVTAAQPYPGSPVSSARRRA